jgi:hypothetical protein
VKSLTTQQVISVQVFISDWIQSKKLRCEYFNGRMRITIGEAIRSKSSHHSGPIHSHSVVTTGGGKNGTRESFSPIILVSSCQSPFHKSAILDYYTL